MLDAIVRVVHRILAVAKLVILLVLFSRLGKRHHATFAVLWRDVVIPFFEFPPTSPLRFLRKSLGCGLCAFLDITTAKPEAIPPRVSAFVDTHRFPSFSITS